ncbi:MAG TPA: hypothetical protein VE338_18585 [Ktedonobacterales bacterium]|jgi:hypothetical protein|nr:hypothetical protein [Ktedonobacterales bacterium]
MTTLFTSGNPLRDNTLTTATATKVTTPAAEAPIDTSALADDAYLAERLDAERLDRQARRIATIVASALLVAAFATGAATILVRRYAKQRGEAAL